ncbi:MAG: AI-2E family transporter [Planctomycetota bacterium]|jgi:predicted PurR-regulated permease PerM
MARYISFAILFAILIVVGVLFYRVMIGFFVPVFMAVVLVVVFRPLHRWVLSKVGGRDHVAASITTCLIVLIVLLPTIFVLSLAAVQGTKLIENFNESSIRVGLAKLRDNDYLNLESPCASELQSIQAKVQDIQKQVSETNSYTDVTKPGGRLEADVKEIRSQLNAIPKELGRFASEKLTGRLSQALGKNPGRTLPLDLAAKVSAAFDKDIENVRAWMPGLSTALDDPEALETLAREKEDRKQDSPMIDGLSGTEQQWVNEARSTFLELSFNTQLAAARMSRTLDELTVSENGNLAKLEESAWQLVRNWQDVRETILGGKVLGFLKDLANPSSEQVRELIQNAVSSLQPKLISFGGDSAAFLIKLIVGVSILILSLYFFLCDGPGMVQALMNLSPLDDRYEMELLAEFDRTSRAIVLATILSAIIQGLTAGIGYYFAGMPSLVMLTALTTIFALIPFFGTGLVWGPVCLYLAIYEERFLAAGLLAAWGFLVVGTVDNLIKVLILHGQSQLHPLLALLSVLGGLQALGPIGIVVGPLVVTLLQTTLTIISHELKEIHADEDGTKQLIDRKTVGKSLSGIIRKVKKPESPLQEAPTLTASVETAPAAQIAEGASGAG